MNLACRPLVDPKSRAVIGFCLQVRILKRSPLQPPAQLHARQSLRLNFLDKSLALIPTRPGLASGASFHLHVARTHTRTRTCITKPAGSPKYFTEGVPSNILGLYTPKIFHGRGSVKYLGGLQPQNISRKGFRQIFAGSTAPKYFTLGFPSNIGGLYTPKIFQGRGSVKYLGGLQPPNI